MQSKNYFRKGFGLKAAVQDDLKAEYESPLIHEIRANSYTLQRGGVTIRLAEAFGFCWGVDKAVSMAYETHRMFPDRQLWITNEIIHNPLVNQHLRAMGIRFLDEDESGRRVPKNFDRVSEADVVILPAFGASTQEMQILDAKNCVIVDTTCPWVSAVWNRVGKYDRAEFTSIIHGKYQHEETVATASRARRYLVVLNLEEAQQVCDYILDGGDRRAFLAHFGPAACEGFDPDRDLVRVGIANQTTMLKGETERIGKLFERTMMRRYGPANLADHFMSHDTICDATQERQDAMFKLVEEPLDLLVVIGGYNSSNTTHLQEIAVERGLPSFHIDGADRLVSAQFIEHRDLHSKSLVRTKNWLPAGAVTVGVTAGASTPDRVVAEVIARIFELKGVGEPDAAGAISSLAL
ncbi:MAG: 4-hydroxy-3-methylbut-2-enyl diphosphate reductase [Aphanocapsa lilacina HA4352-LM1]|jgi:4-hydroxy-3-methylbut-2-enyl diphosphate reductase|nr:4-hydroxy-3-methylbut-2-enyl diphosphate reductase [Aphanocapsa lilacina HA4352-LM1]